MKKVLYSITSAVVFIALTALAGCNMRPSTLEEQEAQAKVDSALQDLKAAQKTAVAEDWEAFKVQSEAKIRMNELTIADLKDRMSMSKRTDNALYIEKIKKLEKQNEALKARIKNHEINKNRKENWADFKKEFNHDLDELGQALKDLTVNNEK